MSNIDKQHRLLKEAWNRMQEHIKPSKPGDWDYNHPIMSQFINNIEISSNNCTAGYDEVEGARKDVDDYDTHRVGYCSGVITGKSFISKTDIVNKYIAENGGEFSSAIEEVLLTDEGHTKDIIVDTANMPMGFDNSFSPGEDDHITYNITEDADKYIVEFNYKVDRQEDISDYNMTRQGRMHYGGSYPNA